MYKIPRGVVGPDGAPVFPPAAPPPPEAAHPGQATPPEQHQPGFYALSASLTGFSETELRSTGVGDLYLEWLARAFPDVTHELLEAWQSTPEKILADPKLGPFARAVLTLWYTATWHALSEDWVKNYGKDGEDDKYPNADRSFGAAYPEGLMWRAAIGAHPQAARPTGFGTWAFKPDGA